MMKLNSFCRSLNWKNVFTLACVFFLELSALASERAKITTFDAPGAGTGVGQGTFALGISPSGEIEGYYIDTNNVFHGFLRNSNGAITTFDVPGAGTDPGQGTVPESINPAGAVTGGYTDGAGLSHGFLRTTDGTITSFDAPGAAIPISLCGPQLICSTGTQAASINTAGAIAGQFVDASGIFHGFLRSPDGTITTFDAADAGTSPGQGTFVTFTDGINQSGTISGGYLDANSVLHSMVRKPDGRLVPFLPPASGTQPGQGANSSGINSVGTVTSYYWDANNLQHGYIRSVGGSFTIFDVPGAGTSAFQGTLPFNINSGGDVVGAYIDSGEGVHGFLRTTHGAITTFDVAGSQGTIAACNSPSDAISGFYYDNVGAAHGFLRTE